MKEMPRFLFSLAVLLVLLATAHPFMLLRARNLDDMPTITDLNKLLEPGKHRAVVRIDDHNRIFIFITPKGFKFGSEPLPIVFFLHGAGGSAEQAARTYGWVEKANQEHFFVAFPEGLAMGSDKGPFHVWRDGRGSIPSRVNDVFFFEELLNKLQTVLPIDPRRIYVTGFSNGAGMTFTLGAHFPDRIAAIAPVSSQSFVRADSLAHPLPVYYLTDTADPFIPYHGGKTSIPTLPFGKDYEYPPVQETVDQWVKLDGCPRQPQVVSDQNGVRVLRYGPGRDRSEVLFTTIEGNGHHWPGSVEPLPPAISGPTLDPFNATDRIWDFFKHHPLAK